MTVSKNPEYKAKKRMKREKERYINREISEEEYMKRIENIKEYYEV